MAFMEDIEMRLSTKLVNNKLIHWNSCDNAPILTDDGNVILAITCICFALDPSECFCGCTSWDTYSHNDWDSND